MNENNARIYIFPYGSMDFFILESFEKLSGKSDHRKESNWITLPLTTDFNYILLRKECRDYAIMHPLAKEPIPDFSFDLEEMVKNALAKNINKRYGNAAYSDETNIVMLSNSTLELLKKDKKDDVILSLENQYNKSNSRVFDIQFTCEADFIRWAKERMEKFPDESTLSLLDRYYNTCTKDK